MRTTVSMDDDVAIPIEKIRGFKDPTFTQIVNDALREGSARLASSAETDPFQTRSADIGHRFYPNLDKVCGILYDAEDNGTGR